MNINNNTENSKLLRTNSKKFKANIKKYLLECIDQGFGENAPQYGRYSYTNARLRYLLDRFENEYLHDNNCKIHKGNMTAILSEWLSGLAINIDFYNWDIIEVAKKLHETDEISEDKQEKFISQWFDFLAHHLVMILEEEEPGITARLREDVFSKYWNNRYGN